MQPYQAPTYQMLPDQLSSHYSLFFVNKRILLTGHSHQAWPDVAFEGQKEAFLDAANFLDYKWEKALLKADKVRTGYGKLLEDDSGYYSLSANTHDLLIRFLSAFDFSKRPKIITTDSEFHTVRRQLDRLAEESWVEVCKVKSLPVDNLYSEIAKHIDDKTSVVIVSAVFFNSGQIAKGLTDIQKLCEKFGVKLLIDVYHALNVVPFSLKDLKLENAFIIGGGYKYCQLGEGNAFLRFPKETNLRPLLTGWFAEMEKLSAPPSKKNLVSYSLGNELFAGATYDPTSHYRAARVFDFFEEQNLTPKILRQISQRQIKLLTDEFDSLSLDPKIIQREQTVLLSDLGGFLVLRSPCAAKISSNLHSRGVFSDYRGESLRLGPAPYVTDTQIVEGMRLFGEVVRELYSSPLKKSL